MVRRINRSATPNVEVAEVDEGFPLLSIGSALSGPEPASCAPLRLRNLGE